MIFAVHDGPTPSFVAPVDPPPPIIDLVATSVADPTRWFQRTGIADTLGGHLISSGHTWGMAVHIVTNPVAWLKHRGLAVLLLDDTVADHLIGVPAVTFDPNDLALAGASAGYGGNRLQCCRISWS